MKPQSLLALVLLSTSTAFAVDIEGPVDHSYRDYFKEGRATEHFHVRDKNSGEYLELKFKGNRPAMKHGQMVKAKGKKNGKDFEVEGIEVSGAGADPGGTGSVSGATVPVSTKKAIVILVNFTNATTIYNAAGIIDQLYTNANSVSKRYARISMGHINLVGDAAGDGTDDVVGPYTINYTAPNCDYSGWGAAADAAAKAAGVDLTKYTHRIYGMPSYSALGCGWAGLAWVGCGSSCQTWFAYNHPSLAVHELGHNFGMWHASTDSGDDGSIDSEYADYSDEMGSPYANRNFNAPHLHHMGWLNPFPGRVVDVTNSGRYEIQAIDTNPELATLPFALRLPRDGGGYYYLSLRKQAGEDAGISASYTTGVNIHSYASGGNTKLVRVLSDAQSFSNAAGNIRVTQIGAPVNGVVSVDVSYAPPPDTTLPNVSITSPAAGATVSGVVNVAVSASDNVGVASVVLSVDGVAHSTDVSSPYAFSVDTNALSNGSHTLAAVARDAAGNYRQASITVNVNNVPLTPVTLAGISPNSMRAGATVSVTVTGSGFVAGTKLNFVNGSGSAPTVSNLVVNATGTSFTATLKMKNGGPKGSRVFDVNVTNSTGGSATLTRAFTVTN